MTIFEDVEKRLEKQFNPEHDTITFSDPNMDGRHFSLTIISDTFTGKTKIERHKMVYACLEDLIETGGIHALQMTLKTPAEVDLEKTKQTKFA